MAQYRGHYQQQNEQLENELSAKTNRLKAIAIKIGDEARFQNDLLRKMVKTGIARDQNPKLTKNPDRVFCWKMPPLALIYFGT